MWEARKARDLHRDPRFSLHAATIDKALADGDARISGRAAEIHDDRAKGAWSAAFAEDTGYDASEHGPFHLFKVDVTELVLVQPGANVLVIQSWRPGEAPRRFERTYRVGDPSIRTACEA